MQGQGEETGQSRAGPWESWRMRPVVHPSRSIGRSLG